VPAAALRERRAELPSREAPLLVVADLGARAAAAAADLESLGYSRVAWLDAPLDAVGGGLSDRAPAVPLWRPAPFLEEVLPRLPRAGKPRALDVAAGSGRDSVYLALNGYAVEAWDRDAEALARASALAARHGVSIETRTIDLEREGVALPAGRYALVVCFRYLHRPLLPSIERAIAPGGHLVLETFRAGQERFGKPQRERFLLRPGELPSAFASLEIVQYAELEPAGGPVTARLLARKPSG
jgi:tellurite methyltransferase